MKHIQSPTTCKNCGFSLSNSQTSQIKKSRKFPTSKSTPNMNVSSAFSRKSKSKSKSKSKLRVKKTTKSEGDTSSIANNTNNNNNNNRKNEPCTTNGKNEDTEDSDPVLPISSTKYEIEWMVKTPPPQSMENIDTKLLEELKELFAIKTKNGIPAHIETEHRLWWLYRYNFCLF
jgi:sRNA-binding protein